MGGFGTGAAEALSEWSKERRKSTQESRSESEKRRYEEAKERAKAIEQMRMKEYETKSQQDLARQKAEYDRELKGLDVGFQAGIIRPELNPSNNGVRFVPVTAPPIPNSDTLKPTQVETNQFGLPSRTVYSEPQAVADQRQAEIARAKDEAQRKFEREKDVVAREYGNYERVPDSDEWKITPIVAPTPEQLQEMYPKGYVGAPKISGTGKITEWTPMLDVSQLPGMNVGSNQSTGSGVDRAVTAPSPYELEGYSIGPTGPTFRYGQQPEYVQKSQLEMQGLKGTISKLERDFYKVKDTETGPGGISEGMGKDLEARVGYNSKFKSYQALRKAVLGQVAKIVSREGGRLTDQDIKRVEEAIPNAIWDTREDARAKFDNLESLLNDVFLNATNRSRFLRGESPVEEPSESGTGGTVDTGGLTPDEMSNLARLQGGK